MTNAAEVYARLRRSFVYAPGDNRATGYLDDDWLTPIVDELELFLGVRFTIVAFQAYADGTAETGWHTDRAFDAQAIVSLGATRSIGLISDGHELSLPQAQGDLLYMPSGFQQEWMHCIPPDPTVTDERCSLVFRTTT